MMAFSEWIYHLLLAFYPMDYRRAYGDLMAQAFRDGGRDALTQGRRALVAWWWRTLTDAAVTIVIEHLEA